MIKAIVFDFDNTLSNRQQSAYETYDSFFRPLLKDMDPVSYEALLQDILAYDCNGTLTMHYRLIPFLHKYGSYFSSDFEEKFTEYFYHNMYRFTPLKKEVIEVLTRLKEKYKVALLSNGDSFSQHHKIQQAKIESYFDEIIVTGDYNCFKPDPRIFEIMAEKLNVKCEECMMVGDVFSSDILGAVRANMVPVWITNGNVIPSSYYHGYRIDQLMELFEILKKEEEK